MIARFNDGRAFDDEWIVKYSREHNLNEGEQEVLRAIMNGYTNNDEIARIIGITKPSVKHRLVMMYARTGTKDKSQLVLSVLRNHFLK